jgi:four helix bundle protein
MKEGANNKAAALRAAQRQTPNAKRQTPSESGGAVYDLDQRLLEYAARIIRRVDSLHSTKAANHVGGQLLRSGTSPLGSHGEAQAAGSIDDFIHKLKICLKELQESWRWLRLIRPTPLLSNPKRAESLVEETEQLVRIFAKSIRTAEANRDGRVNEESLDPKIDPWVARAPLAFGVEPPAGPVNYRKVTRKRRSP